jgi:hypothetical protein
VTFLDDVRLFGEKYADHLKNFSCFTSGLLAKLEKTAGFAEVKATAKQVDFELFGAPHRIRYAISMTDETGQSLTARVGSRRKESHEDTEWQEIAVLQVDDRGDLRLRNVKPTEQPLANITDDNVEPVFEFLMTGKMPGGFAKLFK